MAIDAELQADYIRWWEAENSRRGDEYVLLGGERLLVRRQVFSPAVRLTYSTTLTHSHLVALGLSGKRVIDVGTGCGVLAILAARLGAERVTAIDIDSAAVENARENVSALGLANRVEVRHCDLAQVDDQFDVIVANLPISDEVAFWGDQRGHIAECQTPFVAEAKRHLRPGGTLFMAWASFGAPGVIDRALKANGFTYCIHEARTFGVTWSHYEAKVERG